jgi:hypothetical protein
MNTAGNHRESQSFLFLGITGGDLPRAETCNLQLTLILINCVSAAMYRGKVIADISRVAAF